MTGFPQVSLSPGTRDTSSLPAGLDALGGHCILAMADSTAMQEQDVREHVVNIIGSVVKSKLVMFVVLGKAAAYGDPWTADVSIYRTDDERIRADLACPGKAGSTHGMLFQNDTLLTKKVFVEKKTILEQNNALLTNSTLMRRHCLIFLLNFKGCNTRVDGARGYLPQES